MQSIKESRPILLFSVFANRFETFPIGWTLYRISSTAIRFGLTLSILSFTTGFNIAGEPYVPDDDSVVLEVLPEFLVGGRDKFVEIQDRLRDNPNDESLAQRAAKMFVHAGEEYSDPRFLGLARTVIEPWWTSESVPVPILLLRAKLKEKNQLYDEAIVDLIQISSQEPTEQSGFN